MTPGRLQKKITRAFMVSWRDQPTRFDIEALQANIRRVGLVVRVRWLLILVLVTYSLIAGGLYTTSLAVTELARLMAIPALTLAFVVVYNTYYSLNYRRLGNIAVWNNLQLALDAIVVTVLVYYSGGVNSWFWSMYALFILEATFILPGWRSAWIHAGFSCLLLGLVEWTEFAGLIPHVVIPFGTNEFHRDIVFVSVRYLWQVAVLLGVASVATSIVGEFRRELAAKGGQAVLDEATGLYSRSYFMRALAAEIRRAERDGRPIHVMLIDFDRFGEFNRQFGIDAGDRLLQAVSTAIAEVIAPAGDVMTTANVMARYGGEEFAVLFAEDARIDTPPTADDLARLADQVRAAAEQVTVNGAGVTVSVGCASMPRDGRTMDVLLDAADAALAQATAEGGNRTRCSAQFTSASE